MKKLLIANRGEIACRIIKSCKERGISSLSVYSGADDGALHTRLSDETAFVGEGGYLDGDSLIAIAKELGCDGIHPGYGFLSERGDFAEKVEASGLVWVGPPATAVATMGDKIKARSCAVEAGVRVVPGCDGVVAENLAEEAAKIGYPVLLKATAGGGGRGMRVVYEAENLHHAFSEATRESEGAFGDGRIFMERFIENPRHIEVQLMGDKGGGIFYFGIRECTLQRRHQKVIEEAPSVAVDEVILRNMGANAVELAKAVGYYSAGTVEFICGEDGVYYFLEMNTRLQVEHPVTEEVYGVDLVGLMLDVAQGRSLRELGFCQDNIEPRGWSFEARICAEDTANGFLPSFGTVERCIFPREMATQDGRIRVDAGIEEGDSVSLHYDAMFAKIITWAKDRESALGLLLKALDVTFVYGIESNVGFLGRLLSTPEVARGEMTTGFIEKHYARGLSADVSGAEMESLRQKFFVASVKVFAAEEERLGSSLPSWYGLRWWSGDAFGDVPVYCEQGEGDRVLVKFAEDGNDIFMVQGGWQLGEGLLCVIIDGCEVAFRVWRGTEGWVLEHRGWKLTLMMISASAWDYLQHMDGRLSGGDTGEVVSPMPGVVRKILVEEKSKVVAGTVLCVIEAMKMENSLKASKRGLVEKIFVSEGQQVGKGEKLFLIG